MSKPAIILKEPALVHPRLSELGLSASTLTTIVGEGEAGRASATELDPPSASGMLAWIHGVRAKRAKLIPLGYEYLDIEGCPVTRHPDRRIAIIYAAGNESTGLVERTPTTKYPKGEVLFNAIRENSRQMDLFACLSTAANMNTAVAVKTHKEMTGYTTYLLMVFPSPVDTRAELSAPASFDDRGFPASWSERIILPVVPRDPTAGIRGSGDGSPDGGDDLDIPVVRRAI